MSESNKLKPEINRWESLDSVNEDKVIDYSVENIYAIWSLANLEKKEALVKQLFEKI